eukprot:TRINITY_DN2844_c0_g1_i10.p1 TRINITY_DN2844_c0_g1~~TRINITY_DN2844_c0_g1_i10.p1  ORF type:complete len:1160 (+),score=379.73 TRINITY_DN2844_c0_g1_i10:139-3480(+)
MSQHHLGDELNDSSDSPLVVDGHNVSAQSVADILLELDEEDNQGSNLMISPLKSSKIVSNSGPATPEAKNRLSMSALGAVLSTLSLSSEPGYRNSAETVVNVLASRNCMEKVPKNPDEPLDEHTAAMIIQRWYLRRKVLASWWETVSGYRTSDVAKRQRHRLMVLNELVETEKTFVNSLTILIQEFLIPVREMELLTPGEVSKVFSVVETIAGLNKKLLTDMEEAMKSATPDIGSVFLEMAPFLKVYAQYVNNYTSAMPTLAKLQKTKKKFNKFLEEALANSGLNDLPSFLIMPVQRIPRYRLLLQDLLKFTDETHATWAKLTEALELIKEIADYINERKRQAENRDKVIQIQQMLSGDNKAPMLIDSNRLFIQEGLVHKKTRRGNKLKERLLILFNDMAIATEYRNKKKDALIWHTTIDLACTVLVDLDGPEFELQCTPEGEETFTTHVVTESMEDKAKWMNALRGQIEYLEELNDPFRDVLVWSTPKVGNEEQGHTYTYGHAAVAVKDKLFVFGGTDADGNFSNRLSSFDVESCSWTILSEFDEYGPTPRNGHTMCQVRYHDREYLMVFGGTDGENKLNDVFFWDLEGGQWNPMETYGDQPTPRSGHTAVVINKQVVVFGGRTSSEYTNDLFILTIETLEWSQPEQSGEIPGARAWHSVAKMGSSMYLFGGSSRNLFYNNVHVLKTLRMEWTELEATSAPPPKRVAQSMTVVGRRLFVFGGSHPSGFHDDLYLFDTDSGEWVRTRLRNAPGKHAFHTLTAVAGNQLILLGGKSSMQTLTQDPLMVLNTIGSAKRLMFDELKWNAQARQATTAATQQFSNELQQVLAVKLPKRYSRDSDVSTELEGIGSSSSGSMEAEDSPKAASNRATLNMSSIGRRRGHSVATTSKEKSMAELKSDAMARSSVRLPARSSSNASASKFATFKNRFSRKAGSKEMEAIKEMEEEDGKRSMSPGRLGAAAAAAAAATKKSSGESSVEESPKPPKPPVIPTITVAASEDTDDSDIDVDEEAEARMSKESSRSRTSTSKESAGKESEEIVRARSFSLTHSGSGSGSGSEVKRKKKKSGLFHRAEEVPVKLVWGAEVVSGMGWGEERGGRQRGDKRLTDFENQGK